jgi:Tfp pilus assembly protein PilF
VSRSAYSFLLTIFSLIAWPSWAQRSGAPAPSPAQPGVLTPGQPPSASQPPNMGAPRYVAGQIVLGTGQPVPESVSVGLNCGPTSLQVIHTDAKGYFRFNLEAGPQSNMALSAAEDASPLPSANGMNSPAVFGSASSFSRGLTGCELRVSASGYQPLTDTITDPYPDSLGVIDVGTLQLKRAGAMGGSAVGVASLQIPAGARKEFDKGVAEARSNHLISASQHFENAVAKYDKYAAAWTELGKFFLSDHEMEKARHAFEKAIAADPQYIASYLSFASLAIQTHEYEQAVETSGKAFELDPGLALAGFLNAVGNFNLNRLDAAEASARGAEKAPHQNLPQLHALLANILLQKQEYSNAAIEMQTYLKESPGGPFAGEMQRKLGQIEKAAADAASKSESLPAVPQTAPSLESWQGQQALLETPATELLASAGGKRAKTSLWVPPNIDAAIPPVTAGPACALPNILSQAGKRIEELVENVNKFTATEVVLHQKADRSGQLAPAEIRRFNYLVTIARTRDGGTNVEEYRDGGPNVGAFPDHIATIGTPALVLIFHPHHVKNFQMECEGLGQWEGRPAWQVRFEERRDSRNSISAIDMNNGSFGLRLRGRAWILADSYQVARLETDLADVIPKIRLRLQHQDVEYGPVPLPQSRRVIWLPSSTEMYMDFLGRRFYRRHSFTDFKFFSVKVQQTIADPKGADLRE